MARSKIDEGKKCVRKDVSMEPEQYKRLCDYCQKVEHPRSWVIRKALDEYLLKTV